MDDSPDTNLSIEKFSNIDPNGFLFSYQSRLLRAIRAAYEADCRELLQSKLVAKLISDGLLVGTSISELRLPETGCRLILEHAALHPVNYCVEWCPEMLQDAGLLTIDLCLHLLEEGFTLQDASPWNVIFKFARPVHVDFTSIVRIEDGLLWPAYQQFIDLFLNPLFLYEAGKGEITRRLLTDHIRGIELTELRRHLGFTYALRHPLRMVSMDMSILLARTIQRHRNLKVKFDALTSKNVVSRTDKSLRRKFYARIRKQLAAVKVSSKGADVWESYYEDLDGSLTSTAKVDQIAKFFDTSRYTTLLDLGCNTGRYSILAAEHGLKVTAVDSSALCISKLYRLSRERGYQILPIIGDVTCPTPALGFLAEQFPSFINRYTADLVLFLGIMHHVHLSGRQPFPKIAELLARVSRKAVIFEFIAADDENITLIHRGRTVDYKFDKVRDALGKHFSITTFDSDRATRKLLLCEK